MSGEAVVESWENPNGEGGWVQFVKGGRPVDVKAVEKRMKAEGKAVYSHYCWEDAALKMYYAEVYWRRPARGENG